MVSALHLPVYASIFCSKKWAVFELHRVSFRHVLVITRIPGRHILTMEEKICLVYSFVFRSSRECLRHIFFGFLSTFVGLSAFKTPESHPLSDNTKYFERRNNAKITAACWKIWYWMTSEWKSTCGFHISDLQCYAVGYTINWTLSFS